MTAKTVVPLAYQRKQAAAALDMSVEAFDKHVRPNVTPVYAGDLRLWSVAELQRWLDKNATGKR